ncbi:MAG: glycosyltransferase family 4 protein [Phycisphaerae bacterium]
MTATLAYPQQSPCTRDALPRVCVVNHNAYGQLTNQPTRHAGGAERQTAIAARWFAANGYEVSVVVWDEGQQDNVVIDGVRVIKMCTPDAGLPIVRFVHPRWTTLNTALRRADADVYLYNRGDLGLGQLVRWCRRNRRKSLYFVASDVDCVAALPEHKTSRERILYRYGVRNVDYIVAQTSKQKRLLREQFDRDAVVLPMPSDYEPAASLAGRSAPAATGTEVLWVGRIADMKRLEWLLDLAEKFPAVQFNVAGDANNDSEYVRDLKKRAVEIANVALLGRLAQKQIRPLYERASLFCNTSVWEGFPNTFLEAWSVGLPLLTTFQPDDLVEREKLGWMSHSFEQLCDNMTHILSNPEEWRTRAANCWKYYCENHALHVAMSRYAEVACELATA